MTPHSAIAMLNDDARTTERPNGQAVPREAPVVLVISHVVPFPPAAGNEIRILKLLQWLKSRGFHPVLLLNHDALPNDQRSALEEVVGTVHFIRDDFAALPPTPKRLPSVRAALAHVVPEWFAYRWFFGTTKKKRLRSDGIKAYLADRRLVQLTRYLADRHRPVAVIAEYIFATPCLDVVPRGVLKIVDTHDVYSRRAIEVVALGVDDAIVCSRREEQKYLLKSDVVMAIQPNEARILRDLVSTRDVITVGIDLDVVDRVDDSTVRRGVMLVVGSDNPLNQHGLKAFYDHAWPTIRSSYPEAILRVVGKLANHLPTRDPRVELAGWVPDLASEYRKAALVINPIHAGTGLKVKSVEALCHAKALVGTPNSVEGLPIDAEPPFVVCRDWPDFAAAALDLLRSDSKRVSLEEAALRFARTHFSSEAVYAPLAARLQAAVAARA